MYQESYSAIKKALNDVAILILIFILTFSGSLMIYNGDTAGNPPEVIRLFLASAFFLVSMLNLYGIFHQIKRMFNFRGDWKIIIDENILKLETPDDEDVESFEYNCNEIKKMSREAYEDDGICHKWFIFFEKKGQEIKKEFDLVPFSEEKIVYMLVRMHSINAVEVDIKGRESKWCYSFIANIGSSSGSLFGVIILLSFLIPSILYLVKVVADFGG